MRKSSWTVRGSLVAPFVFGSSTILSRHQRQQDQRFPENVTNEGVFREAKNKKRAPDCIKKEVFSETPP